MKLSDQAITEFQDLYKKIFGIEISKQEASEKGARLVRLLSLIYPLADEKIQDINNDPGKPAK